MEGTGIASMQSSSESYWKFMGNFEATITETDSFCENLEKLYEIWNEIDVEVVRNPYENYTNRLLDVKRDKGVMTRY